MSDFYRENFIQVGSKGKIKRRWNERSRIRREGRELEGRGNDNIIRYDVLNLSAKECRAYVNLLMRTVNKMKRMRNWNETVNEMFVSQ